jgi:hypothetical protein
MPAVLGRGLVVAERRDHLRRRRRSLLDGAVAKTVALEDFLRSGETGRGRFDASRRESRLGATLAGAFNDGRYGSNGEISAPAREFLNRESGARRHQGKTHLNNQLVVGKAGGKEPFEEISSFDEALPRRAARHHLALKRLQHHR